MSLNSTQINLKKIALVLAGVQGLTYTILALICIILHNRGPISINVDSYIDVISFLLYSAFLYDGLSNMYIFDYSLKPNIFVGVAVVYLVLNFIWCALSVHVWSKTDYQLSRLLRRWSILTGFVCLWDVISVAVLSSDYQKCFRDYNLEILKIPTEFICANTFLIAVVIAARGFVLWIINAIFAVFMFKLSQQIVKQIQSEVQQQFQPQQQQQYQPHQIQRQPFQQQPTSPYSRAFPQQNIYSPQPNNENQLFSYPNIPEPDYHNQS